MKDLGVVLAFVCGCLTALALEVVTDAHAASGRPVAAVEARARIEGRLETLERRAHALALAQGSSRVVAPFQVLDAAGRPIFSVTANSADLYGGGKVVASMSGDRAGGRLVASSSTGRSVWLEGSSGPSFSVVESGTARRGRTTSTNRLELGKSPAAGTYRLKFTSKAGLMAAGIGEDLKSHTGLAIVSDKQGKPRARLGVSDDGNGLVDVLGGTGLPIAQLTAGAHGGGLLIICAVTGCPPRMVEIGDAGGFGMVSTGPHWFNPGSTMFSLPGSVLFGRP